MLNIAKYMLNVCLRNKDNNDCYDYWYASKPTGQCGPVLHMDQSPDYFHCPESETAYKISLLTECYLLFSYSCELLGNNLHNLTVLVQLYVITL